MIEQTYTYSQLSSKSVGRMVASHYGFDKELICRFYVLGLHDNYLIESKGEKFILRIYRNSWRSEEEIKFELELLVFLNTKTEQVAKLVPTENGNLMFPIRSPEGVRVAALFCYADGLSPGSDINVDEAELLARSVANVHNIADTFTPTRTRQVLDVAYLLDESINTIKPFLDVNGFSYLCKVRDKLYGALPGLEKEAGVYGLCLGDVNPTNFHIDKDNKIILFDFDQCGYGYRAFEIGKFFSSVRHHNEQQDVRDAFLKGYQSIRSLSQVEQEAIPFFEIMSVIWVMAIQCANADRIGYKYLEKPYWDRRLADLENLVSACELLGFASSPR